jgi:Flp pilus assembly pilin Flp
MSQFSGFRNNQVGQAMTEFLLLSGLVGIALALGSPSVLEQLISALQTAYLGFSNAMSMP